MKPRIENVLRVVLLALVAAATANGAEFNAHGQTTQGSLQQGLQFAGNTALDVPFEPSSLAVVEKMIRIAEVSKEDVVYDLGCGDGRIVITAAKKTGCRGVGIDIDPERIKESKENAAREDVSNRTHFIVQNLFDADIRGATVVMIFLYPEVNIRLRPKILNELSPGARLVSHMHNMGDWLPDKTSLVGHHEILYWVIPANASGTWKWTKPGKGENAYRLDMEQKYQQVRGVLFSGGRKITLSGAKLTGRQVTFTAERDANGRKIKEQYAGTIGGNTIAGTIKSRDGKKAQTRKWTAVRDPSTMLSVDGDSDTDHPWH